MSKEKRASSSPILKHSNSHGTLPSFSPKSKNKKKPNEIDQKKLDEKELDEKELEAYVEALEELGQEADKMALLNEKLLSENESLEEKLAELQIQFSSVQVQQKEMEKKLRAVNKRFEIQRQAWVSMLYKAEGELEKEELLVRVGGNASNIEELKQEALLFEEVQKTKDISILVRTITMKNKKIEELEVGFAKKLTANIEVLEAKRKRALDAKQEEIHGLKQQIHELNQQIAEWKTYSEYVYKSNSQLHSPKAQSLDKSKDKKKRKHSLSLFDKPNDYAASAAAQPSSVKDSGNQQVTTVGELK